MLGYLVKIGGLLLFSLFVIQQYYYQYNHVESFNGGYYTYIILIAIIYAIYKGIQSFEDSSDIVSYSTGTILGFTGLHLLLLSCMFFVYQGMDFSDGFNLFFKILGFLFLPIVFSLISISIGKKILSFINGFTEKNKTFQNIISLVFGFFLVLTTIIIIGMIGFYNVYSVVGVLLIFGGLSLDKNAKIINDFFSYKFTFSKSEGYGIKLLSTEFLFILSTLLISVNLISAFRPFPIGWDDLGAYMNYAQLLANSGEIFNVSSMFSWQAFTGIGYIFNSPTQAFFLNNVGGILSFILMIAIFSDLLQSKTKKFFINIPMLLATIFIAMPMFIFEQAKDMKLDPGLYFVSIAAVYGVLKLLLQDEEKEYKNKVFSFLGNNDFTIDSKYIYYIIIGIIAGFTFSIKFTSLILISGFFALVFYARLGLSALFGYLAIFFAIFTKFGLWKMMNVVYPSDNSELINNFSVISFFIGIAFFFYAFASQKEKVRDFLKIVLSSFIGVLVALAPWFIFNTSTADQINISALLSGKSERLKIDYTQLYSEEEIKEIQEEQKKFKLNSKGTTGNEDWGRYFGYEEGINNYIKLPWNLTMQTNQKGEFTDITYIYLALLPLLLLFLPFRRKYFSLGVILFFLSELLLFVYIPSNIYLTKLFSQYSLPGGYVLLILGSILPLLYFHFTLKDEEHGKLFKCITSFTFVYGFLWMIAAYGVVWYGIGMYFAFLLMIGIGFFYAGSYTEDGEQKDKIIRGLGSVVIFIIIAIYFFVSSIPHAFINLKGAVYKEFKSGKVKSTEAPFVYHRDYLKILFELNIAEGKQSDFILNSLTENTKKLLSGGKVKKQIKHLTLQDMNITDIKSLVNSLRGMKNSGKYKNYQPDIRTSLDNIYGGISHPSEEFKNTDNIYRIGTFLKYYISQNNKRLLEDSLVTKFDSYILADTPNKTVENIKTLGLKYFLVDLNAATIDKDPRRNLTKRYESLLKTFTSDELELVATDSICFQTALETYQKSQKTDKEYYDFLLTAGVNYDSYTADNRLVGRKQKLDQCHNKVIQLMSQGKVTNNDYTFLIPIMNHILSDEKLHNEGPERKNFLKRNIQPGRMILYKLK
ncbi:MAG: hypothetical protein GY828_08585 [Candidatus Gracilibacteria bacterium]|nr:hypothetical protein [Candidatus Gracilibacteria bacterium]